MYFNIAVKVNEITKDIKAARSTLYLTARSTVTVGLN